MRLALAGIPRNLDDCRGNHDLALAEKHRAERVGQEAFSVDSLAACRKVNEDRLLRLERPLFDLHGDDLRFGGRANAAGAGRAALRVDPRRLEVLTRTHGTVRRHQCQSLPRVPRATIAPVSYTH